MKYARTNAIRSIFLLAICLSLVPAAALAQTTKKRTCGSNPGQSLQQFLNELNPGDTLIVSGTCNENVLIHEGFGNITVDGQGTAVINGSANPNAATVTIRGRGITLKGFTIIGGRHGVQIHRSGTATVDRNTIMSAANHGVGVLDNGTARIVDNVIEGNGANGICVCEHSVADIGFRGDFATAGSPNIVRNNGNSGIVVADASYAEIESNQILGNANAGISVDNSSSAKIGAQSGVAGTFANGNTIQQNGNRGIVVARSSSARIVENKIRNNTGDGVSVVRGSQADVAANAIDGNTGNGVLVSQNSGVNLGSDGGTAVQDQPNSTTANNGAAGILCGINSFLDGRQGTLNGITGGPLNIVPNSGCVNSLIP